MCSMIDIDPIQQRKEFPMSGESQHQPSKEPQPGKPAEKSEGQSDNGKKDRPVKPADGEKAA
jgi:hypothetical protein